MSLPLCPIAILLPRSPQKQRFRPQSFAAKHTTLYGKNGHQRACRSVGPQSPAWRLGKRPPIRSKKSCLTLRRNLDGSVQSGWSTALLHSILRRFAPEKSESLREASKPIQNVPTGRRNRIILEPSMHSSSGRWTVCCDRSVESGGHPTIIPPEDRCRLSGQATFVSLTVGVAVASRPGSASGGCSAELAAGLRR